MELKSKTNCVSKHSILNNKYLTIYHQNVRSLGKKANELLSHVYSDPPHIICITEHHMNLNEINLLKLTIIILEPNFVEKVIEREE